MGKKVSNLRITRHRTALGNRIRSEFTYGFDHVIEYEKSDRIVSIQVSIRLDGAELYRKEGGVSMVIGSDRVPFEIDGDPVGVVKITGLALAFYVRVTVAGTDVLTT